MINLDADKTVLLAPLEEIGLALATELRRSVHDLEKNGTHTRSDRAKNNPVIKFFRSGGYKDFAGISEESLQGLVAACGRGFTGDLDASELKTCYQIYAELRSGQEFFLRRPAAHTITAFISLTKITLISLWAKGLIILPRNFSPVKIPHERLAEIAETIPANFLYKALSANPSADLVFEGNVDIKLRKRACNHWLRLIFNTDWHSPDNVIEEDIRALIDNSRGSKHPLLGRYYVIELLTFLFADHPHLNQLFEEIIGDIVGQKNRLKEERKKQAEARRAEKEKNRKPRTGTPYESKTTKRTKELIAYAHGTGSADISSLIGTSIAPRTLRHIFFRKKLDVASDYPYSELGDEVQKIVHIIDRTFQSFIDSKRLEKRSSYEFLLSILLCYVSIYLPRFFKERDGDLRNFPTSFNALTCAYFIARNEHLAELVNETREAPLTYFKFMELLSDKFDWEWNTTTYGYLMNAQRYFKYIELLNDQIPDAEKFKCTVAEADIPKTSRKTTTVKNVLPREYFRVFISLLETLDYFIDHLNGMADGTNPGVLGGELVSLTYNKLCTQKEWRSIWPEPGKKDLHINVERLNYTPVVRFEDRYYPLKQVMRFYWLTPYRINGIDEERATPHVPRVLWLMTHTGIRQKHLLWLDKDGFDAAIPEKKSGLAPLIVSTDKAHAEWVSVVSREVIDVCQRQRTWLERNEIDSLKEPMWYSGSAKSRFGKFIPLFRLDSSHTNWDVHEETGKIFWMLEKLLRHEVGEIDCPQLAHWKPRNTEKTPGPTSDHITSIDDFDPKKVDSSWEWRVYTPYTPHGLRAAFISERMRFLPPSLIGRHLTGQFSDDLVWYYTIMEAEDVGDHQQLLVNLLMRNEDRLKGGGAPELAEKITEINRIIAKDIETDPDEAISTHGLFSLSDVDDSKNGIAELKAKQYTKLACNSTHICPFGNVCPSEVVQKYGLDKPCTICPYAIRGIMHLPAINAAKFRAVELMEEYGEKIKAFKKRPKTGALTSDIESMESQYDRMTRDAFALEAIEQQLYHMRDSNSDDFMAQDSETIKNLYEKLELGEGERLIKRLIDVQCFPDLDSPGIQRKFAALRYKLMVASGNIRGLLESHEEPENALLASQLHSMMSANGLNVRDVYKLATANLSENMDSLPQLPKIGFDKLNLVLSRAYEAESE